MYSEQSRRSYLENEKLTEELKLKAEIETLLKKKSEACESLNAEVSWFVCFCKMWQQPLKFQNSSIHRVPGVTI